MIIVNIHSSCVPGAVLSIPHTVTYLKLPTFLRKGIIIYIKEMKLPVFLE